MKKCSFVILILSLALVIYPPTSYGISDTEITDTYGGTISNTEEQTIDNIHYKIYTLKKTEYLGNGCWFYLSRAYKRTITIKTNRTTNKITTEDSDWIKVNDEQLTTK